MSKTIAGISVFLFISAICVLLPAFDERNRTMILGGFVTLVAGVVTLLVSCALYHMT